MTLSAFVDSQRPCYHAESKTGNISYLGTEMLRTCREKTGEETTEADRCHRKRQEGYSHIYIIKEKPETLCAMESYLPTSDRHAASWIFSDGPSKQLGVVKLRYNALKLFFL